MIFLFLCLNLVFSTNILWAKNPDVAPSVNITSPQDGAIVSEDTLNVVVSYGSKEKGLGNVRYIILKLDGAEFATYQNPANVKEGTHTFTINLKELSFGKHTLQAFAYQAEIRAGLEGKSAIVTFTKALVPKIVKEISASNPVDLAVDADRNLYILESSSSYITLYDKEGNYLRGLSIGASYPKGMAVDKSGNIYIADTGNNRILKLDSNGYLDTNFGDNGIVTHDFSGPYGIGVDSAGDIYVTDTGNNRIQKFDKTGKFVKMWGSPGTEPGQFNQPKGIFVDGYDHIYVVDSGNNRIQEFSTGGSLYNVWGEAGSRDGQFNLPVDIAASPYYIYVADTGNNRVQKFSEEREFISEIANLNLSNPQGIAIDSDLKKELIYIADTGNNRVLKVELPIIPPGDTWDDMKENLTAGKIEDALTHFSEGSQEKYREIFTLLKDELPRIVNEMQDIHLLSIRGDVAEYIVIREENGEEMGYFIYFIKDKNDNWKIDSF